MNAGALHGTFSYVYGTINSNSVITKIDFACTDKFSGEKTKAIDIIIHIRICKEIFFLQHDKCAMNRIVTFEKCL